MKKKKKKNGLYLSTRNNNPPLFSSCCFVVGGKHVIRVIKYNSEANFSCNVTRKSTLREPGLCMMSYEN